MGLSHLKGLSKEEIGRRAFLTKAVALLASFIGGALAIPAAGQIISPALKKPEDTVITAGTLDQFEVGQPKKIDFFYYKRDGWIEERTSGTAWVVRKSESEFTVFNPRCTHLGCPYSWSAERSQFICPCHNGVFSIDGRVVAGPPPRPLDRFQYSVEGGKLLLKEVGSRG